MIHNTCPLKIVAGNPGVCDQQCKFRADNGDCELAQLVHNLNVLTSIQLKKK